VAARAIEARQPASVPKSASDRLFYYATLYGDIWAPHDLLTLPLDSVKGTLRTDRAYYTGVGLGYALIHRFSCRCRFVHAASMVSPEVEGQIGKEFRPTRSLREHFGAPDPQPSIPRFSQAFRPTSLSGEGVSYAYRSPEVEAVSRQRGAAAAGPRKYLDYLAFEMEFSPSKSKIGTSSLRSIHRSAFVG